MCLCILWIPACDSHQKKYSDPEIVEMTDSDRSVQYYLPMNITAWASGGELTTEDLQPSGRLLLTSGGNVKAAEYSDGYKKVHKFRCEPIGGGWYEVTCWLWNTLADKEYTLVCYTRQNI